VRNCDEELIDRKNQPRMPWHDVQVLLEGPIVYDLCRHFVERWNFSINSVIFKNPKKKTIVRGNLKYYHIYLFNNNLIIKSNKVKNTTNTTSSFNSRSKLKKNSISEYKDNQKNNKQINSIKSNSSSNINQNYLDNISKMNKIDLENKDIDKSKFLSSNNSNKNLLYPYNNEDIEFYNDHHSYNGDANNKCEVNKADVNFPIEEKYFNYKEEYLNNDEKIILENNNLNYRRTTCDDNNKSKSLLNQYTQDVDVDIV
jgi:phospholipase D1/2